MNTNDKPKFAPEKAKIKLENGVILHHGQDIMLKVQDGEPVKAKFRGLHVFGTPGTPEAETYAIVEKLFDKPVDPRAAKGDIPMDLFLEMLVQEDEAEDMKIDFGKAVEILPDEGDGFMRLRQKPGAPIVKIPIPKE